MDMQREFENFEAGCEGRETARDFFEAGWNAARVQQEPVPPDDLRQAALIDLAYINGAKAGWNMCVADDESQFQKLTEGVAECVNVLKNTRSQATAQPVQPAACQYCNGTGDVHGIDGEWRGECNECTPAQPSYKERCQAEGWRAVSKTLDEVVPGWTEKAKTGMEAACNAIRELAQPVQPAVAQGDILFEAGKAAGRQEVKDAQSEPDFWAWVRKAYREPESTNFTIHNMEVAYQAGRESAAAINEQMLEALKSVALVAHHGGLIDLSESEALILIRNLTVQHHDWKQTIKETRVALKRIAAEAAKEQQQ